MPFTPVGSEEGASYPNHPMKCKAAAANRASCGVLTPAFRISCHKKGGDRDVNKTWNMLQKWLPRLAFYLFAPAVLLVCWGELSKTSAVVDTMFWDKGLHFIAYFGLSGLVCVALKADRRVLTSTLLLALFGAILEVLQGVVGRDPSVYDEIANVLGAIAGAGIGWLTIRLLLPKTLAVPPPN